MPSKVFASKEPRIAVFTDKIHKEVSDDIYYNQDSNTIAHSQLKIS